MARIRSMTGLGAVLAVVALAAGAERGPALQGRIVDEAGRPLPGAKVILYGGAATRWKVAEAETDADGRYRFDTVRSSMMGTRDKGRWDYYVGVRVEHPTHVEADGKSWRDIRFPSEPKHVETLDLRLTPAGRVEGIVKDAKTGEPVKGLDLRIESPPGSRGHGATFHAYAKTDDRGRFRTLSLFPGAYDVEANSTTLDYALIGRATVEPGKTAASEFAVTLPRVIEGRVVDDAAKPIDGVFVTILAAADSGVEVRGEADFQKVRTRAWTITRPAWQERFQLAFLPGLEGSRFVLAYHKELGWAKAAVEDLARGEPIRLRPWGP